MALHGAELPGLPSGASRLRNQDRELLERARAASAKALTPVSEFMVGAALRTVDDRIYAGCNVEDESQASTTHAEQAALVAAVFARDLAGDPVQVEALAVFAHHRGALVTCTPCGACRQLMSQFGPQARVLFIDGDDIREVTIADLLPFTFRLDSA